MAASLAFSAAPAAADNCATLFPSQPPRATLSTGLPDCRAYEQVNPVFKGGGTALPFALARGGNAMVWATYAGLPDAEGHNPSGGARQVYYLARRTASGWRSSSIEPSATQFFGGVALGFPNAPNDVTPGLDHFLFALSDAYHELNPSVPGGWYIATPDGVDGCTTPDGGACTQHVSPIYDGAASYLGASQDFSHLLFSDLLENFVPGDPTAKRYVYTGAAGGLSANSLVDDYEAGTPAAPERKYRLVGLDNSGSPTSLISNCGTLLGSGDLLGQNSAADLPVHHTAFHAISADGSRIFFTSVRRCLTPGFELVEGPTVNELSVRVDADHTIPISEPSLEHCALPSPAPDCADALFEGASADGSRVFFTTTQPETGGADTTENLYEAQLGSSSLTKMTQLSAGDSSGAGAQVQGVVRVCDDGSHVYYVAQGVLAANGNESGEVATLGADNLYVSSGGTTRFIAQLSPSDSQLWGEDQSRRAQDTPDGRFLAFDSFARLTADDTDGALDVYLYDAQTGSLRRVSRGAGGYNGDGNGPLNATVGPPGGQAGGAGSNGAPKYESGGAQAGVSEMIAGSVNAATALSADGSYVFFSTPERLQANDTNGGPDVYEWHVGNVSLLSDGRNPDLLLPEAGTAGATTFAGASASGTDAFFSTPTVLDPAGADGSYDLYDARVGGGFAPAIATPSCQGDACQGALTPTPSAAPPGTANYSGSGNTTEKPLTKKPKKHKPKKKAKKHTNKRTANKSRRASR